LNLRRFKKAIECFERALAKNPTSDVIWHLLAFCHKETGEIDEAVNAAEKAIAHNGNLPQNWWIYVETLLAARRFEEALEATCRGLKVVDPQNELHRSFLFELSYYEWLILLRLKRTEEALKQMRIARRQFPTERRLFESQVMLLIVFEEYERALDVLQEACEVEVLPDDQLAALRFEILHRLGRRDEAWSIVEPMIATCVEEALAVLAGVALHVYEEREFNTASSIYEQLHSYAPNKPGIANNLGFLVTGQGRLEEARQLFEWVLDVEDIGDLRPVVLANLGYLHVLEGALSDAEICLQGALKCEEVDEEAILRIAYWDEGRLVPDPVQYPTRWLPIWMAVQANQVTLALAQNQSEEAERMAREIISRAPDAAWGYVMLGSVLRAKANWEGTRQAWHQAIELTTNRQDRESLEHWLELLPE
jgi:tetratricopeptide (TPR) repeat protein